MKDGVRLVFVCKSEHDKVQWRVALEQCKVKQLALAKRVQEPLEDQLERARREVSGAIPGGERGRR